MTRLRRIGTRAACLSSLLLCLAASAAWVWGHLAYEIFIITRYDGNYLTIYNLQFSKGRAGVVLSRSRTPPDSIDLTPGRWKFSRWSTASTQGLVVPKTFWSSWGFYRHFSDQGFTVIFPLWAAALPAAVPPALWLRAALRRRRVRRRLRSGRCPACGYDLRASGGSGRCPECGRAVQQQQQQQRGEQKAGEQETRRV